ncbi:MAG: ABC transporter permease [Nanoarchaeota archaeon]
MKLHRINSQLLKFWYITLNRIDRWFDILYWPLIDLFVWGFASYFIRDLADVNLINMFLGGIILWVFVWRSGQDMAVFILEDFWSKNLYHLYTTPIRISEHMTAVIIAGFIRALMTFGVLVALSVIMYSFNFFTVPLAVIGISIALLSLFAWSMGMFITSLILRFGQRIQVLSWSIVWVIQPFSCVFYPLSALPPWAANIAIWMPPTAVFENLRAVLAGTPMDNTLLLRGFLVSIALLALVSVFLGRSFQRARKTGLLARGD